MAHIDLWFHRKRLPFFTEKDFFSQKNKLSIPQNNKLVATNKNNFVMITKLIKIANALDRHGLTEEADIADELISTTAGRVVYVIHSGYHPGVESIWYSEEDAKDRLQDLQSDYYADDFAYVMAKVPIK